MRLFSKSKHKISRDFAKYLDKHFPDLSYMFDEWFCDYSPVLTFTGYPYDIRNVMIESKTSHKDGEHYYYVNGRPDKIGIAIAWLFINKEQINAHIALHKL